MALIFSRRTLVRTVGISTLGFSLCHAQLALAQGGTPAATPESSAGFPIEVTTANGIVSIPEVPKRIVAFSYPDVDTLIALGAMPVAIQRDAYTDSGISLWFEGVFDESDTEILAFASGEDIPIEDIVNLEPDLLLDTLGFRTMSGYAQLSEIAPTISGPELNWTNELEDRTRLIGRILDKAGEAERALVTADESIDQIAVDFPELRGLTYSYAYVRSPENIGAISDPEYYTTQLFDRWGMSVTPSLLDDALQDDPAPGGVTLSWENINLLDADAMFIGFVSDDLQQQFEASPLFESLNAVQNDHYFPLSQELTVAIQVPSIANIPWTAEQMRPMFEKLTS